MTFLTANIESVIIRFYVLMIVVVALYSLGYPQLALITIPLFLTAMWAVLIRKPNKTKKRLLIETKEIKLAK